MYYFAEAKHGHTLKFHSTEELIRKVSNSFPSLSLLWSCPRGKHYYSVFSTFISFLYKSREKYFLRF